MFEYALHRLHHEDLLRQAADERQAQEARRHHEALRSPRAIVPLGRHGWARRHPAGAGLRDTLRPAPTPGTRKHRAA
ncbi:MULTISPECIES: hypothetical protein [Streptomyces]|uniref:Uncharacterized protein n=1 Tax=Streptomyces edwardsiae TaxID=3075527 RepID=A0ABU2PVE9_9ACTN|nr:hypothetical protein [Streptomyces sp. DSM 41636]MDT0395812.1 hypothetical protein [Streptomyces sp. DSM 41636]